MPTSIVKAGERGVDFSFAKPPAARLLELGYTFVVGYISVPPASTSKNLTKAQCEGYLAAGLSVLLVWEMSATRPNFGGSFGAVDGQDAKRLAAERGYPTDVPIIAAVDTNTVVANIGAHELYVRAFAEACAPYPIGIYGDTDILARCSGLWRIGWVPNAWSWSGASRKDSEAKAKALGAHVLQRTGFHIDNLWAVDPNDVIADFPAWGPTPTPPPLPPSEEDDVKALLYTVADGIWFYLGPDARARQVRNGFEYQNWLTAGAVAANAESVAHFNEMLTTYQPVGKLTAAAVGVLGSEAAADWDARSKVTVPPVVTPPASATQGYVGTITLTPGAG